MERKELRRVQLMKKIAILCAAVFLIAAFGASAQSTSSQKDDIFYKTVALEKIYTHPLGYKLVYLKSNYEMGSVYVPLTWFGTAVGKGIVVYETPGEPSYFSIFWLNGKFDHIVIHAPSDVRNTMWGIMDASADVSSKFNVEAPTLEF
jgi:hypothetical protein